MLRPCACPRAHRNLPQVYVEIRRGDQSGRPKHIPLRCDPAPVHTTCATCHRSTSKTVGATYQVARNTPSALRSCACPHNLRNLTPTTSKSVGATLVSPETRPLCCGLAAVHTTCATCHRSMSKSVGATLVSPETRPLRCDLVPVHTTCATCHRSTSKSVGATLVSPETHPSTLRPFDCPHNLRNLLQVYVEIRRGDQSGRPKHSPLRCDLVPVHTTCATCPLQGLFMSKPVGAIYQTLLKITVLRLSPVTVGYKQKTIMIHNGSLSSPSLMLRGGGRGVG